MARPNKATVDYFPHSCNDGKTIFILEGQFGDKGYIFWFKLLELLGTTDNHFINCNGDDTWEYLVAKTRVDSEMAIEILNKLAKLDKIDRDFWDQKIIYIESYVENILDAYRNRKIKPLTRDEIISFLRKKYNITISCGVSDVINGVSDVSYTQSKVKESKQKETKEKEPKHKHGEFQNVLLTDKELEKLNTDFGKDKTTKAIEFLSSYKAEKDYKTKSDNLTLRRWVFKAVEEKNNRGSPQATLEQRKQEYLNQFGGK